VSFVGHIVDCVGALFLNPRAGMTLFGERYSMFDIGGAVPVIKHTRAL
jgi:hypothetical protein